jgi:arylsulfatase A-like enzyme
VDSEFHTNVDLAPTIEELFGLQKYSRWDGQSYAGTILNGERCGQDCTVLTQCAHVCQRSARFGDYLYIRTYHTGFHLFDREMLFNIKEDPHQTKNIAADNPGVCARGAKYILDWVDEMMAKSDSQIDPLWTVMRENGPYHTWGELDKYVERLRKTGREDGAEKLLEMYGGRNKR